MYPGKKVATVLFQKLQLISSGRVGVPGPAEGAQARGKAVRLPSAREHRAEAGEEGGRTFSLL